MNSNRISISLSCDINATSGVIPDFTRPTQSFEIGDSLNESYSSTDATTVATISVDLTSRKTKYYFTNILTKRGAEALHVAVWLIKDYLWIRAVDWRAMLSVGVFAVLWTIGLLIDDVLDLFRIQNQKKYVQWEIIKEIFAAFGATLWLTGSALWATAECWDLRHTGGYNEVYFYYTEIAKYIIMVGFVMLTIFWAILFTVEMFGLSKRCYRRRLAREAQHRVLTNKEILFADAFINSESDAEYVEVPLKKDEHFCRPIKDGHDAVADIDISGMPHKFPGFVLVPKGLPNWKTGAVRADRYQTVWTLKGVISFRDYENLCMFLWLWKDLMWLYEDPLWAQVLWYLPVIGISINVVDVAFTTIYYAKACDVPDFNIVTSVLMVGWVTGNIIWCAGELFLPELHIGDDFTDVEEKMKYLIPSIFTSYSNVPGGAWGLRWVGSWILFGSIILMVLTGMYFIIYDLCSLIKERRANRSDVRSVNMIRSDT